MILISPEGDFDGQKWVEISGRRLNQRFPKCAPSEKAFAAATLAL